MPSFPISSVVALNIFSGVPSLAGWFESGGGRTDSVAHAANRKLDTRRHSALVFIVRLVSIWLVVVVLEKGTEIARRVQGYSRGLRT